MHPRMTQNRGKPLNKSNINTLKFLPCLVVREVGNSEDDLATSEDEEQPQNVEVPGLIHPDHDARLPVPPSRDEASDHPLPGDADHPRPGASDHPLPGDAEQPSTGDHDEPAQHQDGTPAAVAPPADTPGLGTRGGKRPRGRPRKPRPAPTQQGWTVEGLNPSAASNPPTSTLSTFTLR